MKHFVRSIAFYGMLLLGFSSSLAQQAPIRSLAAVDPAISTSTSAIADEIPYSYAEDTDGSLYVAGAYDYDNFLGRYNPSSGSLAWLIKLQGNRGSEGIKHIFLGNDGVLNVIASNVNRDTDLDPGPGTVMLDNYYDALWIKYNKSGAFISARKLTETNGTPYFYLLKAANDGAGNVYMLGKVYNYSTATGTKDLDAGTGSFLAGETNFLAKYNASGALVWAKLLPKDQPWEIRDMKVSDDAIYLAGNFWRTMDFDPDAGVQVLSPASEGMHDAFLARYDAATGAYGWAFGIGGTQWDVIHKIAVRNDAVTVCGSYTYTGNGIDVDPSSEKTHLLTGTLNSAHLFMATYSTSKTLVSASRLAEGVYLFASNSNVNSFTIDDQGQYLIGGNLNNNNQTWDVDASSSQYLLQLNSGGTSTGFILKYSNSGKIIWGSSYRQGTGSFDQVAHFIPSRAANTAYTVVGMYQGSTNLDPFPGGRFFSSTRYDGQYNRYYQEMFVASYCEYATTPTPATPWTRYIKAGTSATFKVNPLANATSYSWSVPSGFTITAGNNTAEVVVTANASASGSITVQASNVCGVSPAYSFFIVSGTKDPATITQDDILKAYGDAAFTLQATSNSTNTVTYQLVSNPANAISLSGRTVTVNGLGEAVIAARVSADATYGDGLKTFTIHVGKRSLTARAESYTRLAGAANPPLQIVYSGFAAGENATYLDVLPLATTTANAASPAGVYPITVSGGSDDRYSFIYEHGTLTVVPKLAATVTLSNLTQTYNGDFIRPTVATQPQGLNVKILYNGSSVPAKNAGTYTIEAMIENANYEGSATGTLTVVKASQTINLLALPELVAGDGPVTFGVQATSALPVKIAARPSDRVLIEGNLVTPLVAGQILFTFAQAGNENFHPAEMRAASACIKPRKPVIEIVQGRPEYAELISSSKINNQWTKNGLEIPDATDEHYFTMESGTFTVKVTVDGCENASDPVQVQIGQENIAVSSYPNPTVEGITVSMSSPEANASITVFSDKGLKVAEVQHASEQTELRLSHLPPGLYNVVINNGRQKKVHRLIKK